MTATPLEDEGRAAYHALRYQAHPMTPEPIAWRWYDGAAFREYLEEHGNASR